MYGNLWILVLPLVAVVAAEDPVTNTKYGQIRGKVVTTSGGACDGYFGVPFATPPVNELRWAKPIPPAAWTGVKDTKDFSPACIQTGSNGTDPSTDSEDCLYLNIITPKKDARHHHHHFRPGRQSASGPTSKLPVMVFIHGGVFQVGKAEDFSQPGACENLALRGVVVVVIQYRLGLYGFLSTGDAAAQGNYGLWDQVESLKWIRENIANFGGDPEQVTIFGESAGGISVSFLTYMEVAKTLFKRSIAESGSAYFPEAALKDTSVSTAKQLARVANCSSPESQDYLNCLRRLSTEDMQTTYNSMIPPPAQFFFVQFAIRVDGEMFTKSQLTEIDREKHAIIGVNTLEMPVANVQDIPTAQAQFNSTMNEQFGNGTANSDILTQTARYVYLNSKGDPNNDSFVCQQSAMIQADIKFHIGPAKEITLKKAVGRPLWVYNFEHYNDDYFPKNYPFKKGAWHGHELCYIFMSNDKSPFAKCPDYTGDHKIVADNMGEMWTNFAKTGNPSPKGFNWPQFGSLSNSNALLVRSRLSLQKEYYIDVANFWNELVPDLKQIMQQA